MKSLFTIVFILVLGGTLHAQDPGKFFGSWDFTTETGATGYETGVMVISEESVITTFPDISYDYPSDWVKFEGDTLNFEFDVDGAMVSCYLVVKDKTHLTGFAEWEGGETVLNLTRTEKEE